MHLVSVKSGFRVITIILSLLLNINYLFCQFKWIQQKSGTNKVLTFVDFVNKDTGLVVGSSGTLLMTKNGGENWIKIDLGVTNELSTVTYVNKNVVFLSGSNGLIMKSTDGGLNWTNQNTGIPSMLYTVNFVNENIGFAAGLNGVIIKTSNGGTTWTNQNSYTSSHIYRVQFLNKDTGVVAANEGVILRTYNGGSTWTNLNSTVYQRLHFINFMNSKFIMASGDGGTLVSSSDFGNTWNIRNSGRSELLNCVKIVDDNLTYIVGEQGLILKSEDKGSSWKKDDSGTSTRLVSTCFPKKHVGYAVGFDGKILKLVPDTIEVKYCSNDTTITMTAPEGFQTYVWKNNSGIIVGSGRIITIKNPGAGNTFSCFLTADDGTDFTRYTTLIDYKLSSDFNYTIADCKTNTIAFTDNSESSHNPVTYKWTFGDGTTSTDKNPMHTFATGGKKRVFLEISNPLSSCADTISEIVQFCNSEETEWDFTLTGQTSFCEGDTILIKAEGGVSYVWGNGETTDMLYVTEPGVYEVTATNENCCSKTKSIVVTESKNPLSDFEMSDTKIDILNNKITFSINAQNEVEYSWDLGDGTKKTGNNIEHTFNAINTFTEYLVSLTATTKQGCVSTTTKIIQIIPFVPNVFTPNKDGINELFMPGVELFIYDRYGKTIYKGNSGWDGTCNGKDMPSDTYFYYLTYMDKNHNNQNLKGYLTLIR